MVQEQRSRWHDQFIKKKKFQPGYGALFFYSRLKNFKGKLTTRWMGPYGIEAVFENGPIKIKTIDDQPTSFIVNGTGYVYITNPLLEKNSLIKFRNI